MSIFKVMFIYCIVQIAKTITVAPTWIAAPEVQANSNRIINGVWRSSTTSITVTFATAFSTTPRLCYGLTSYQARDTVSYQKFQIRRTALSASSLSVSALLQGYTTLYVVQIRYIAVSNAFSYHLNFFDNIPVQYGSLLTNITSQSSSSRTYTNTISYTSLAQSISSPFNTFSTPLTNNKILLFLTALFVQGTDDASSRVPDYQQVIYFTATPTSSTTFTLSINFGIQSKISRLKLSFIIFDQVNVESSAKYLLVYNNRICYNSSGGFYGFRSQFLNSFILGFQQYSTSRIKSIIHFATNLATINSTYGAQMPVSIPLSNQNPTLIRYCFTYFYIKSWICPNLTVFDPTINACITCTLANCITCITTTTCSLCNATNGYYLNTSTNQCGTCNVVGCTTCITTSTCLTCNSTTYVLNNQTCQFCDPTLNYFPNLSTQTCVLCSLSNCLNCSSLTQCTVCNTNNSYYLTTGDICEYCNSSQNYFIAPSTPNCVLCTLTQCLNCSSLATCQTCNLTANYLLNTSDNLCYPCGVPNCIQCLNFTDCTICDKANGYTLNVTTGQCQLCALVGCTDCTNTEECAKCNNTGNYILLPNKTCQLCLMGLYSNQTSAACQVCTLPNCLTCLTLTTCSSCNTSDNYYKTTTLTCSYCNSSQNYFINSSLDCELCSIPYCLNCSNLTSCIQCNQTADYFYNSNDSLCYHCAITGCIDCNNLTTCAQCNETADFFYDPMDGKCYSCNITGCIDCLNMTACNICNAHSNYVLNFTSGLCELCPGSVFANYTSNGCQTCNISNCLICSNLYECSTCDTNSSYFLATDLSCDYCNSSNNYFINSSLNCQLCSIPYCLNCSNLTNCSQCNQTADYFYDQSTGQCSTCLLTGCLDCLNISACNICDTHSNFVLNPTTGVCDSCPPNLYANYTSNICENCTITGCQVCSNLYICSSCNITDSYYLTNVSCSYCNSSQNYFINTSSLNCEPCVISNCLTCSNLTTCSLCNQSIDFFADPVNGQCLNCAIPGCLDCFNLTSCNSSCNSSAGYIFNTTIGGCDLCPVVLFVNTTSNACEPCSVANCTTCITLTACSVCDFNNSFYVVGNQCDYCNNSLNFFINSGTLGCQPCSLYQCLNCSSLTSCAVCDLSYNYLLAVDNLCYLCTLPHCLTCQTFTSCAVCDNYNNYYLNSSSNLCQRCSLVGCQQCFNLTRCLRCDSVNIYLLNQTSGQCQICNLTGCASCLTLTSCQQCDIFSGYGLDYRTNLTLCGPCNVSCSCDGYITPWDPISQSCTSECGDGIIRLNQQCDDYNLISGDGCSSSCTIQKYYNCSNQPSVCNNTLYIKPQLVAIQKYDCNGFKITLKQLDFTIDQLYSFISFVNNGITLAKVEKSNNFIEIYGGYNHDITNQAILLKFKPGQTLNITYTPTIPALYYTESQCGIQSQVQKMLEASQYISYAILIVSILSCKIVGLQLFGVLQLSYFTLSSHDYLNMYLAPLAKFKTFNGLNIEMNSQSAELPTNISKLGIAGSFINNCNIMLLVLFGELAVSLGLFIFGKITKRQKIQKIGLRLLKQGFITLVLFNIFNISFSAGVHWKYANPADQGYLLSSIVLYGTAIAMVVAVTAMELTGSQDYGEFKNKFKNVWICRLYVPLTVCYRMALGFYTAVETDYDQSTLIILAFSLTFILYVIINLPFSNVFQNYRCALIHITMLFTLLTTNYYRTMKSTTPLQVKGRLYTPAIIQLILMISCIVASFAVLAYEIYQLIKVWRNQKKTQNTIKQRQNTEESFENL